MQQRIQTIYDEGQVKWMEMMKVNLVDMIVHPYAMVYNAVKVIIEVV